MARLKIGSGITLEAQLPKIEQFSPKIGPSILEKESPGFDAMELIQKAIEMLPKPEPIKEVIVPQKEIDLSHLATKSELHTSVVELCAQRDMLENKVDLLSEKIDSQSKISLPEVKQVTHVQDVSPRVLKECDQRIKYTEDNIMLKVTDLQKQNRKQKTINYVLSGALILTIFLHLI